MNDILKKRKLPNVKGFNYAAPTSVEPSSTYQNVDSEALASDEKLLNKFTASLIQLSKLRRDPNQPRKKIDPEILAMLIRTIPEKGLSNPIAVRVDPDLPGHFILINGETRYTAHLELGLSEIPAYISELTDPAEVAMNQLIDNTHRGQLKPLEIAHHIQYISTLTGESVNKVGLSCGFSSTKVSEYVSLLDAPQIIQDLAGEGVTKDTRGLYDLVKLHQLSPQSAEQAVEAIKQDHKESKKPNVRNIVKTIADKVKPIPRQTLKTKAEKKEAGARPKPPAHITLLSSSASPSVTGSAVGLRLTHAKGELSLTIPLSQVDQLIRQLEQAKSDLF